MVARIHDLGVEALLAAYSAGRVSVVAATAHFLDRISRFDGALKCFVHVDTAGAAEAAKQSAARYDAGTHRPLEGVPIAVKANIAVKGMPYHAGIGALADQRADEDAECVKRLRDAGAIILGITNMHEAAMGATTNNPFFGATQNPYAEGFTPGGSSGGSAAAVAAGLCAGALGSDTLGSIRIPAAYCGITGLKPGPGVVSADGLIPLVPRLDCVGPMTRSVGDAALLANVLASLAPSAPIARIATLSFTQDIETDRAVSSAYRLAKSLLEGLGLQFRENPISYNPLRVRMAAFLESATVARKNLGPLMAEKPESFSLMFRYSMTFAASVEPEMLVQNQRTLEYAKNEIEAVLLMADAILLPSAPQAAFAHTGPVPSNQADYTVPASIAGLPALSIPAGWTSTGLPVGVQLVGRPGSETALLDLGRKLEDALKAWRPPTAYS